MKKNLLILLFIQLCLSLSGTTFYISPNGKDSNNGDFSHPFYTLIKAWKVIAAGDTVFIRGGTYSYLTTQDLYGKNGTSGNLISIWAYKDETPIITKQSSFTYYGDFKPLINFSGNYIHWKGLEIMGNPQPSNGRSDIFPGMFVYASSNCIFELLNIHHNGMGFWINDAISNGSNSDNNLLLNCDIHHNQDPYTVDKYGNADGISININIGNKVTIVGCRIYWNSDDGLDPYGSDATIVIDKCWFFYNGMEFDTQNLIHQASGIKLGVTHTDQHNTTLFYVTNCISYRNSWIGFNTNGARAAVQAYNNTTAYNGNSTFKGQGWQLNDPSYPPIQHSIINNISFNDYNNTFNSGSKLSNNSFLQNGDNNSAYTVTINDFVSLDDSELLNPRQSDGDLPIISFLHLATGSDLINNGMDVGLPFTGSGPDLGAFETQGTTVPANPTYLNSVVENANPSVIEINFNLNLINIPPSSSAFNVKVNSLSRTINIIAIEGTKVLLTISSPIIYGDVVTVSYTKPVTNPLQTSSGGFAATLSEKNVINNVKNPSIPAIPTYVSFIVENSSPTILEVNYNATLANVVPFPSSFSILVNSFPRAISKVAITGTKVFLTLTSPIAFDDIVTISYTKPPTSQIQTIEGGQASSFSTQKVENRVNPDGPSYISSVIDNLTPSILVISFNEILDNSAPSVSAFGVLVNGVSRSITLVKISENKVLLTLATAVKYGDIVVFSYTRPNANQIKKASGGAALSIESQLITKNNVEKKNITYMYPNPATDFINITQLGNSSDPKIIKIFDFSGRLDLETKLDPHLSEIHIPINLKSGTYLVQVLMNSLIIYTQKLIIVKGVSSYN
jgi:uncharacterized repeat protein (TIGR02059 family)